LKGQDDSEVKSPCWGLIFPSRLSVPVAPKAVRLASLVGSPPPQDGLSCATDRQITYTGVPQTPEARKNKADMELQTAQKKMETAMHGIIHFLERKQMSALNGATAYIRSAWEDLQQQRRKLLAGLEAPYILEPRQDDVRPRLLSREEELRWLDARQTSKTWSLANVKIERSDSQWKQNERKKHWMMTDNWREQKDAPDDTLTRQDGFGTRRGQIAQK
jgi:hypothetical protein